MRARARLLSALGAGACAGLLGAPASAATNYRLGVGANAGYNSAFVQPVRIPGESAPLSSGLTLSVTPFGQIGVETGRISLTLRYQFLADGVLLLSERAPAFSYQNFLAAQARFDLTPKLAWLLGLTGSQGRINSFTQVQSPATQPIEATNLVQTELVAAAVSSTLQWDANARLRVTQPIAFRAFVPYGSLNTTTFDRTTMMTRTTVVDATGALQSYSLDGGLGIDYQWARTSLGGEVRFGYFLPQRGSGQQQSGSQALVTGQAMLRGRAELSPRWRGEAQAGVYVATQPDHFLQGRHLTGEGTSIREVQATLVTPVGGASLSYLFPKVDAQLSINYLHGAAGEVFIGRFTLSDALTLRAIVPLPKNLSLSTSVGWRRAELYSGNSLSRVSYGVPLTAVDPTTADDTALSLGQSYNLFIADASLGWTVRDGVVLHCRYAFQYQKYEGDVLEGQIALQDFARHLALVGVSLYWPTANR